MQVQLFPARHSLQPAKSLSPGLLLSTSTLCPCAVLLGPLQSLTFLLNQGLLAATLGTFWAGQAHWAVSVPAAALVRVGGTLAYITLSSWTMNENLFALLMSNVYALLVRIFTVTGLSACAFHYMSILQELTLT
jgi:hypothetical protein